MVSYKIALLGGDGTGPEVIDVAKKVILEATNPFNIDLEFIEIPCGAKYYKKTGEPWPENSFQICKDEADAILLGAIGWPDIRLPDGSTIGSKVIFGLRFGLDLYANIRPTRLYPNVKHHISGELRSVWKPENVDFVIIRENTEGCYTPVRGDLTRGEIRETAIDGRVITRKGAERVIKFAFELAKRRKGAPRDGKKKVTCVDKSNVMRGCMLFREVYDEVAEKYPGIEKDYAYIDAFTQWLVRKPECYDVAVMPNLFGDIATDLASTLQGGMGMAASGNVGDNHGMFEPVHGSSPKYAGKDLVNPIAAVLSGHMMLYWLGTKKHDNGLIEAGRAMEKGVAEVLKEGRILTYDLGGNSKCSEVGEAIVAKLPGILKH
jgi:3-isopropylmalate dehydrogenase